MNDKRKPDPDTERGASAPLSRAARIVDAVAAAPEGLALNRIGEAVALPPSTTHRLVKGLVAIGYLAADEHQKTYRLGRRLMRLLHATVGNLNVQVVVEPILARLVQAFGQVFYVNQLVAGRVRLVAFDMPDTMERILIVPGEFSPIHATAMGKAIYAFEDEAVIEQQLARPLEKFQPETKTDPQALREELAEVRRRGYAISRSEFEMGVTAIAVPVELPGAGVIFAIGVTGFESAMFERNPLDAYVEALREAARELQAELSVTEGPGA